MHRASIILFWGCSEVLLTTYNFCSWFTFFLRWLWDSIYESLHQLPQLSVSPNSFTVFLGSLTYENNCLFSKVKPSLGTIVLSRPFLSGDYLSTTVNIIPFFPVISLFVLFHQRTVDSSCTYWVVDKSHWWNKTKRDYVVVV